MENVVNFAQVKRFANIALHGLESGLIAEMIEVCLPAGEEVVDGNHAPLLGQLSIAKMGSQETGATGNQCMLSTHAFFAPFLSTAAGTSGWDVTRPTL
jgi:hypothetical protein